MASGLGASQRLCSEESEPKGTDPQRVQWGRFHSHPLRNRSATQRRDVRVLVWKKPVSSESVAFAHRSSHPSIASPVIFLCPAALIRPMSAQNGELSSRSARNGTNSWSSYSVAIHTAVAFVSRNQLLVPAHFPVSLGHRRNCLPKNTLELTRLFTWKIASGLSFCLGNGRSHGLLWRIYLLPPVPVVAATLPSPPYQQPLCFPSPVRPAVPGLQLGCWRNWVHQEEKCHYSSTCHRLCHWACCDPLLPSPQPPPSPPPPLKWQPQPLP